MLNKIKQPRKPTKVQQPEPSSENKEQSPKLQQDKIIEPQEKHEAPKNGPRAQQSVPTKHEETITKGEANTNTKWMEAPVERIFEEEPVEKKETIVKGEVNTNTKRMEAPVERIFEEEPIEKNRMKRWSSKCR